LLQRFAAAESYKKNKYQEASAYENADNYPFLFFALVDWVMMPKNSCAG